MLQLDHVFVFVEPGAPERAALEEFGLVESFRREHPGQGTSNVCYCFDNAYLELLWVRNTEEIRASEVARTRLAERANWKLQDTSPFGIAVRTDPIDAALPFPTWKYEAPFLPEGMQIEVAQDSRDPSQPFLFRSPGGSRPDSWSGGRAERRQSHIGLTEIASAEFSFPTRQKPCAAIRSLEAERLASIGRCTPKPQLTHGLEGVRSRRRRLKLPEFLWLN